MSAPTGAVVLDAPDVRLVHWDVAQTPWPIESESVQVVVTSPPYYGLRAYQGVQPSVWEDGWYACLGLESTVESYVRHLVQVFREVRRVLRMDGTVWLVVGDSYRSASGSGLKQKDLSLVPERLALALQADGWYVRSRIAWVKLAPMPESVTDRPTSAWEHVWLLAKSADYYYDADAVSERASHKGRVVRRYGAGAKNLTGASAINDRRTAAGLGEHDMLVAGRQQRNVWLLGPEPSDELYCAACDTLYDGPALRRVRIVERDGQRVRVCPACGSTDRWVVHYAAYPREIPRRAILAGSGERGQCATCGRPWRRVVERSSTLDARRPQARRAMALAVEHGLTDAHLAAIRAVGTSDAGRALVTNTGAGHNAPGAQALAAEAKARLGGYYREFLTPVRQTTGWQSDCACGAPVVPQTVLDPFIGSGTTALVARELGRRCIGLDASLDYLRLAARRLERVPLALEG